MGPIYRGRELLLRCWKSWITLYLPDDIKLYSYGVFGQKSLVSYKIAIVITLMGAENSNESFYVLAPLNNFSYGDSKPTQYFWIDKNVQKQ